MYRASRDYSVPESTLRDRTRGLVDLDVKIGFDRIFSAEEEEKLVGHVSYMAEIGYGYGVSGIRYMAKNYAESLGKPVKAKDALSNCWFYSFLKRWPNLKVAKPQKLTIVRAKSASRDTLDKYYKELGTILTNHNLRDKPQNIYNVDESGVSTEHSPPKIVCSTNTKPQNITSTRSSNVTIIAAGNALGNSVPPYYIFPGQRWNPDFLNGACPGAAGKMSKKGWSNSETFHNYITKHFATFVKLSDDKASDHTLILYDGHKSHISLTLSDWAKKHNVTLFVLPPHSSHLTQPLDVAVFGPFKAIYNSECQAYMKKFPGANITSYQIAELTNKPYLKALSAENLISAFRRTGIHPFNNKAIPDSEVAPSLIYKNASSEISQESKDGNSTQEQNFESSQQDTLNRTEQQEECSEDGHQDTEQGQQEHEICHESEVNPTPKKTMESDFFEKRTITTVVQPRKKRKFVPPYIAGSLLKKTNEQILKDSAQKTLPKKKQATKNQKGTSKVKCSKTTIQKSEPINLTNDPRPSTSGTSKVGGPIDLSQSSEDSEYTDIAEDEKCCVCHTYEAGYLKQCVYVSFVSWGKCDFCPHWTHLKSCSEVRVVRRGDVFRCPHCLTN